MKTILWVLFSCLNPPGPSAVLPGLRSVSYTHLIAEEADATARAFIKEQYGEKYVIKNEQSKKNGGKIQDAHEAIRPTDIALTPTVVKESLQRDLFRLYQLIWKRFTASRMDNAVYETTSVKITAGGHSFTTAASRLLFDGFMSVYV